MIARSSFGREFQSLGAATIKAQSVGSWILNCKIKIEIDMMSVAFVLCSHIRSSTHTMLILTKEHKWVTVFCQLNLKNARWFLQRTKVLVMWSRRAPSRHTASQVALCYIMLSVVVCSLLHPNINI